ncbi:MAG TPA: hypothetical protein VL084_15250, partial [Thermoanaerobaculia bacterium]|nr:hypothetical protein [Thermoanaerobaculia bacterium]
MRTLSKRSRRLLLSSVALSFLFAFTVNAQRPVEEKAFRALDGPRAAGVHVVMEPILLDDGTEVALEVSPLEVFAPGAEIVVH